MHLVMAKREVSFTLSVSAFRFRHIQLFQKTRETCLTDNRR